MKDFSKLVHKGKTIFVMDIANTKPTESMQIIKAAEKESLVTPPKSVLFLTDVTNAHYDKESAEMLKDFAKKNTTHIKASAVVGAEGMRKVLLMGVSKFTGRNFKLFNTRNEALDWLATQ